MAHFFSQLRYSFGNEDWRTEQLALPLHPQANVLCITASGDRPLNLLSHPCQRMVCIDANPAQNHLLHLKSTAMQNLPYQDYIAFLGATPSPARRAMLYSLLPHLQEPTSQFWLQHIDMIDKGILYQGSVERLTRGVAFLFSTLRKRKIEQLFSFRDLDAQRQFVREEWDHPFLRGTFRFFLNPWVSRLLVNDPGLTNVGRSFRAGEYIYQRINRSLEHHLACHNPLLSLVFRGVVSPEAYSPYLTEEGVKEITPHLNKLEVHTQDILSYLEQVPAHTFDLFSLSDVASYLKYPDFVRLLTQLLRTAKPGARFCMRQFLSTYDIPLHLSPFFIRQRELETQLEEQDTCFVYRFLVGNIRKEEAPLLSTAPIQKQECDTKAH